MKENFLTRMFGGKEESVIYTAEDVHRDLTAFILLYLSDIQEEIERKEIPTEISKTASILEQFGLTNTTNAQIVGKIKSEIETHNLEYERKKTQLAFMQEVWKKFGKDAMVVRYDHFFQILEKYDMVCGSFDRYTGAIPQSALETLSRLGDNSAGLWGNSDGELVPEHFFAIPTGYFDRVRTAKVDTLRKVARMPFVAMEWSTHKEISNIRGYGIEERDIKNQKVSNLQKFFIAAPAADMKPIVLTVSFADTPEANAVANEAEQRYFEENNGRRIDLSWSNPIARVRNNAIRAYEERIQTKMEESGIGRYCKLDFIKTQPLPERKLYDPFICSLTPCGVLIHAKWGPEAEDATIKRYEQLRDAVIGKGGAV